MNLNLVHVDAVGTNLHQHLVSITGGVSTVGGGEVVGVWPPLFQKRVLCKVGGITTSGQDDRALKCCLLAVECVGDTGSTVAFGVDLGDLGLLDELDALWLLLSQLFESLHQSVCDGHAGELGIVATVGTRLGVTTVKVSTCVRCGNNVKRTPTAKRESDRG